MTAKDHNKLFSILMMIKGGLSAFGALVVVLIYGGIGLFGMSQGKKEDLVLGGIFVGVAVVVGLILFAFAFVEMMAGWKMFKEKSSGRAWGIVASIASLINIPLGTALGVYGLWFLFGDQGKQFYGLGGQMYNQMPPPPPQNWK
jgi:hypothetical protein